MSRFNKESNRGGGEPQVGLITFGGRARFMMPRAVMCELGPMSDLVPKFPLAFVAMALSAPGLGMLGPGDFSPCGPARTLPAAELTQNLALGIASG